MEFSYHNPAKLIFGEGSVSRLGDFASSLGGHALLVTGRSAMAKAGYLQKATDLLRSAGLQVSPFSEIPPNPTLDVVVRGGEIARRAGCDMVVGLGGGSAMDGAKAIAVAATHDCPMTDFLLPDETRAKRQPGEATLPIILVTSTAGTSSELTPFAVISLPETCEKPAMASPHIYAKVAIEDPELTYTAPRHVTASTGVDVFCHAAEGFISTVCNPITDAMALRAMELVVAHLPQAVNDGHDREARRGMMLANTFAGYVLAQAGGNVMHALEHPMSGHHSDLAHGAGLAAVVVAWAELMWRRMTQKFAAVARTFGVSEPIDEEAAPQAAGALKLFLGKVGMDVRLRELGIERNMLDTLADDAMRYMNHAVAKTPGGASREDLMQILQASY